MSPSPTAVSVSPELLDENRRLRQRLDALEQTWAAREHLIEGLRRSEASYRSILRASPDDITIADLDGTIRMVSTAAVKMFGYEREDELVGRSVLDGLAPEERGRAQRNMAEMASDASNRLGEYVAQRADLGRFDVEISSSVVKPVGSAEPFFVFMVRDISSRKQIEAELALHRERLQELVNERTVELEAKNRTLVELNAALKVLLGQRDADRQELEERFVTNLQSLVYPYLEQIKRGPLSTDQRSCLDAIDGHLRDIATPLIKSLQQFNLSPREVRVATLIKQGKATKEIAQTLAISCASVEVHRKNIRKKLDLTHTKSNLQMRLQDLRIPDTHE